LKLKKTKVWRSWS